MASQTLADLMQSTADENQIKFYFVTKSGDIDEASEDLKFSYQIIGDFESASDNLNWISDADCLRFEIGALGKENVFVFEKFEGEAFNHISSTKAIIVAPKVLISCQSSNDVVPNISSPIYTLALRNAIVCVSGIDSEKRNEIHRLVGYMGGLASKDLIESTTHLVTNTNKSPKYAKAALGKMKIMKEEWVFALWQLSKNDDDSYTTDEFFQKYKFPIFHGLVITSTGIQESDKNEIMKLIGENGGTYSGSFKSKVTDILITQPNQRNSEKFKAAVKCKKECLMMDWVKDSVSKGYALPFVNYRIYTGQQKSRVDVLNSTQISNATLKGDVFNPDATQISVISYDFSLAETISSKTPVKSAPPSMRSNYKAVLDSVDIGLAKNAKGCLDGCTIWLCGFDGTVIDKLKKMINIGGGTRIDEHGPDVEYAIVGKPSSVELTHLKSADNSNIVTVDWLVACFNAKRIVDAKDFVFKLESSSFDSQTVPSPATRKNIQDMNPTRRNNYLPRQLRLADDDETIQKCNEKTLLDQYAHAQPSTSIANAQPSNLGANAPKEETDLGMDTEESNQIDANLFQGRKFALFSFSEESTLDLCTEIEDCGGVLLEIDDYETVADYLVIPAIEHDLNGCRYKAKETVTDLWIQQCLGGNEMVAVEYYHRPITVKEDCRPLQGLTIVFSTYTTPERDFLAYLAEALGSEVNDRYMRNQNPILVCPTAEGKKYLGAIKWDRPVVTCDWLKKCQELERRVPMKDYLVGESKSDDKDASTNSASDVGDQSKKLETTVGGDENDQDAQHASKGDENACVTPVLHPRISSIRNTGNRRSLSDSPKTPLGPTGSGGENYKSPATELCEDMTPITRKIVYEMFKEKERNETPLTKRRRIEATTLSPIDMSVLKPDYFEILDSNYVEVPKRRKSTPFVEYRKRFMKEILGDKYDGTPLKVPLSESPSGQSSSRNPPTTLPSDEPTTPQPSVSNADDGVNNCGRVGEREKDGSTQVQEFFDSIKKCRDSRPSRTMTQELLKSKGNDPPSDSEQESEKKQEEQIEVIDWRDPDDYHQSERFKNRSTFKGPMRFSMSSAIDIELKNKIEALGGTVCEESAQFDPTCTHLICSKPNQSEKTLSVIASGRWLLCPAYVEESFKAGHFLNEEEFEWGNPDAKANLPDDLDHKSIKIARVSYTWRKELQLKSKAANRPVGIFSGFCAILHSNRKDSFKRLLEAGCGVVVDIKEPYSQQTNFLGITHCFVDRRAKELPEAEKRALQEAGVHVVTILYLQACLQEDTLPSVKDFLTK